MALIQQSLSYLRQKFPEIPLTRRDFERRSALIALVLSAFLISLYVKPFIRMLAMGAILSAFAGAGVLWWESNLAPDEIESLVRHIERTETTAAERVMDRVAQVFALLVWCLAILRLALYAWLLARPHGQGLRMKDAGEDLLHVSVVPCGHFPPALQACL
jgi:hypothetical protein